MKCGVCGNYYDLTDNHTCPSYPFKALNNAWGYNWPVYQFPSSCIKHCYCKIIYVEYSDYQPTSTMQKLKHKQCCNCGNKQLINGNEVPAKDNEPDDVDSLELATQVRNALVYGGIKTIGQLRENFHELKRLRRIGDKSIQHIKDHLEKYDQGKRGQELWG